MPHGCERYQRGTLVTRRDAADRAGQADETANRQSAGPADAVPAFARTATLDDPLTTSLLAEVARRSKTIDVSPEQIDEAIQEIEAIDAVAAITDPAADPRKRTRR